MNSLGEPSTRSREVRMAVFMPVSRLMDRRLLGCMSQPAAPDWDTQIVADHPLPRRRPPETGRMKSRLVVQNQVVWWRPRNQSHSVNLKQ